MERKASNQSPHKTLLTAPAPKPTPRRTKREIAAPLDELDAYPAGGEMRFLSKPPVIVDDERHPVAAAIGALARATQELSIVVSSPDEGVRKLCKADAVTELRRALKFLEVTE